MARTLIMPPRTTTLEGKARQVGVEIELAGLGCAEAAEVVLRRLGGTVSERDPYRFELESPDLGIFVVELDTQYAHPRKDTPPKQEGKPGSDGLGRALEQGFRAAVGEVTSVYMPVEVVCPPLSIEQLPVLDEFVNDLREAGAQGTKDSIAYAFGLQLNVEPPALDAGTILAYLRAFLVSVDVLRREMGIDLTRRVLPFIQPHDKAYVRKVLNPRYRPEMPTLIADYVLYNPTRNRDLDLLPLFFWLDPERVRASIDDPRLKGRPTLHYRLPDSHIEAPEWGVVLEWNRWAKTVERLAEDRGRLEMACIARLRALEKDSLSNWAEEAMSWLRP